MGRERFASRRERLGRVLGARGISALWASTPVTMGYLSGFTEGGGERLMAYFFSAGGGSHLVCPALSVTQAQRAGVEEMTGVVDGEEVGPVLARVRDALGISGVLAVDDETPAAQLLRLQGLWPDVRFVAATEVLADLMRAKDASELEALGRAGSIADAAFEAVRGRIRAGMTEREVAGSLAAEMSARGGVPAFGIVAAGSGSAEPHHHSDETVLREGDVVVIDFGCTVDGYHSDITRTVSVGRARDEEAARVYAVVLAAHLAARAAVRPGVTAGAVDAAARGVIEAAGYGEFFTHRTGHGLGLRIHEAPNLVPGSDTVLAVGDVFSVEPGIYLPGRFGVRIENIVTVTEDGHRSFNAEPSGRLETVGV